MVLQDFSLFPLENTVKYLGKIRQMNQQCPLKSPSVFPHCLEDFLSIQAAAKPRDRLRGAVRTVEPIGVSMGVPV